ncbi:MAG: hypothetical protein JRG94_26025, partial [Deltaproteobacteria bacterium]|nr:hypothetical protein [Deltaproteobacteria bacterium]
MRFQLLLALFLAANSGCSDAEESTLVQPRSASVARSTATGALRSQAEPRTQVSSTPASPARVPSAPVPPAELADWMRAARSGSLILHPRDGLTVLPGLGLDTEILVSVTGTMARVKVRQRFANPTASWVEGIYVFPLPEDAAVDQMRIL